MRRIEDCLCRPCDNRFRMTGAVYVVLCMDTEGPVVDTANPDLLTTTPGARVVSRLLSRRRHDSRRPLLSVDRPLVPVRLLEPCAARAARPRRLVERRRRLDALPSGSRGFPPSGRRPAPAGALS